MCNYDNLEIFQSIGIVRFISKNKWIGILGNLELLLLKASSFQEPEYTSGIVHSSIISKYLRIKLFHAKWNRFRGIPANKNGFFEIFCK